MLPFPDTSAFSPSGSFTSTSQTTSPDTASLAVQEGRRYSMPRTAADASFSAASEPKEMTGAAVSSTVSPHMGVLKALRIM